MTEMFSPEEKAAAFRTKRRLLILWLAVLFVYLAALGVMIGVNIYQVVTTRSRAMEVPFTVLGTVLTALFAGFSLFFFSIKFRLTRAFVRMLRDMERGLKDTTDGKFIEYDDNITEKDGVYFYAMVLDCKPLKRGDITMRKVLVEHTRPKPALAEGDVLTITTHANILMWYEIKHKTEAL